MGVLGGALLVGGVILSIASGIASNRLVPEAAQANDRPAFGSNPRHMGPGRPGPDFGDPRQRGLPRPGQQVPQPNPAPSG